MPSLKSITFALVVAVGISWSYAKDSDTPVEGSKLKGAAEAAEQAAEKAGAALKQAAKSGGEKAEEIANKTAAAAKRVGRKGGQAAAAVADRTGRALESAGQKLQGWAASREK